jgi:hypothetical protein
MVIKQRSLLIVLGMHRSGTSAISGILDLLDFNTGSSLLPPQPDNPKGFFENQRIVDFNDKCLTRLGASWSESFLFPPTWYENDTLSELIDELAQILKEELNFLSRSFLKDPRLCVLMPLYLKAFLLLEITPYFIVCLRNPSEIAYSLKKRNSFSEERTILLWLDYMLKAELYSRNYKRRWIEFNALVSNPVIIVQDILTEFGYSIETSREKCEEIEHFIESTLKHHNEADMDVSHHYIPEIELFFKSLLKLKGDGESPDTYQTIDHLRGDFYNKYSFFHALSRQVESRFVSVQGSNEIIDLAENVKMGVNLLNFDLDRYGDIDKLIFIPANVESCCVFNSISVTNKDGLQIPFTAKFSGRFPVNTGELMVYKHEDYITLFEFEQPQKIKNIRLTVTYYAFGDSVKGLKMSLDSFVIRDKENLHLDQVNQLFEQISLQTEQIQHQEAEINILKAKITFNLNLIRIKESQIESLMSSWTWKVGKIFLWPAHFIYLNILAPVKSKIQPILKKSNHL